MYSFFCVTDYELVLGEHEKLFMDVNITNHGESAYQAMLFINLAEYTSYSKSTDLISMVSPTVFYLTYISAN